MFISTFVVVTGIILLVPVLIFCLWPFYQHWLLRDKQLISNAEIESISSYGIDSEANNIEQKGKIDAQSNTQTQTGRLQNESKRIITPPLDTLEQSQRVINARPSVHPAVIQTLESKYDRVEEFKPPTEAKNEEAKELSYYSAYSLSAD